MPEQVRPHDLADRRNASFLPAEVPVFTFVLVKLASRCNINCAPSTDCRSWSSLTSSESTDGIRAASPIAVIWRLRQSSTSFGSVV